MDMASGGYRRSAVLRAALLSGLATALLATLPGEAAAYSLFGDQFYTTNPRAPQGAKRKRAWQQQQPTDTKAKAQAKVVAEKPQNPLTLVISIKSQKIALYGNGKLIETSIISTGTPGHDTPQGVFSVIEKDRHHRSNIYSAAPMPYMQRITWSGVALHEGFVTGRVASHGCIRLPQAFAARLWEYTQLGVRVIVAPDDVVPVAISHDRLFAMKPKVAPAPVAALPDPVPTAKIRLATNATTDTQAVPEETPVVETQPAATAAAPAATPEPAEADPLADGRALTDLIRSEVQPQQAEQKPAEAAPAQQAVTEPAAATLPAQQAVTEPTVAPATEPAVTGTVQEQPAQQTVTAPAAATPPAAEPVKEQAATEPVKEKAKEIAKEAPAAAEPPVTFGKPGNLDKLKLGATGKEYPSRPGAITVLISRATAKLYVRKGFWPVFETPVKIAQPDVPFGTHVFTALEPKNATELNWNVVSVPNEIKKQPQMTAAQRRLGVVAAVREHVQPANPSEVLNRISIPDEAIDRISELMTPGASLIVSDMPISHETNRGTDFVILTR